MAKKLRVDSIEILVELARIRLTCGVESPFPEHRHLFFPDKVKILDLTPAKIAKAREYIDRKLKDYGYEIEAVQSKTPKTGSWKDSSYDDVECYNLYVFMKKK